MNHNIEDWLVEYDLPTGGANPDAPGMQAPDVDPNSGTAANPPQPAQDPNITNQQPPQDAAAPDDVTQDPESPDMPEEKAEIKDFETWKNQYLKETIKGDTNTLIEMLNQVRDKEGLLPYQRKFVEDNMNVQLLRMNSNIEKASRDIRRQIRQQLDKNNPATSVVNHVTAVLETVPSLNNVFVKLNGYAGMKGDLHRKFIASLLCAVQVGSGADTEDLIYNEKEYSILLSTRFNARWGDVMLGSWNLKEDDPERYLSEPELKRLSEGSPQEKESLRKRVVAESMSQLFETRAFIINVVTDDGNIITLGWDIATSIRSAFIEGRLAIKFKHMADAEAMLDTDGEMVSLTDISISFVKETGKQDEDGNPEKEEISFIERRNGMLFLSAGLQLLREASTTLQGMSLKEVPYAGNPSDLRTLQRCVYNVADMLLRNC